MGDTNTMSPADFAAMTNGMGNGNQWYIWMIFLFFLCFGFGGWGGNGWGGNQNVAAATDAAIAAQGGYVTSNQLNDQLRMQELQQGQRDLSGSINAVEQRLTANQTSLLSNQAANAQAMQACCSTINYNAAQNTAAINANTDAKVQKVLDTIQGNKIEELQNQVSQLQLQNAMAGVVKFPMAATYSNGANPFCGCGSCVSC